jgi:hypothetical protein
MKDMKAKAEHFFFYSVVSKNTFFIISALKKFVLKKFLAIGEETGLEKILLMCFKIWTALMVLSGNLYDNRVLSKGRKLEIITSKRYLMIKKEVIEYSEHSRLAKIRFGGNSIAGVVIEGYFSSK